MQSIFSPAARQYEAEEEKEADGRGGGLKMLCMMPG
jgi:hypothetical protein